MELLNSNGKVTWESPSNIALIKYWGKLPGQLPMNASLSITLKKCITRTEVIYNLSKDTPNSLIFTLNGKEEKSFTSKINNYLQALEVFIPEIENFNYSIHSYNTFPHSSGIASSASAFSALALCFYDIWNKSANSQVLDSIKVSEFARLGSGSAARSVFGGMSLWGKTNLMDGSSNEFAIPVHYNHSFGKLFDAILIVNSAKKKTSSTAGHALMDNHPFREGRLNQASHNLAQLLKAIKFADFELFSEIVENEAMTLHALMMSSPGGGYFLFHENTVKIINIIRNARKQTGIKCCFTLDAGPNIHLIYPESERNMVLELIQNEISILLENNYWIDDEMGEGPIKIN